MNFNFILLLILQLLFTSTFFGQNINGKWIGNISQTPNSNFRFILELEENKGKVTGYSIVSSADQSGKFDVRGIFNGNELLLTETRQLSKGNWCKKFYKLDIKNSANGLKLIGDWNSNNCNDIGVIEMFIKDSDTDKLINSDLPKYLQGVWTGILTQEDKDFNFYYQIVVPNFDTNNKGTSYNLAEKFGGGSASYIMEYDYDNDKNILSIEEIEIIYRDRSINNFLWCVKDMDLKLTELSDRYILEGDWVPNFRSEGILLCSPGTIRLEKIKYQEIATQPSTIRDRRVNVTEHLVTSKNKVTIAFYDHGQVDGDIVSIYLNGNVIANRINMTKEKYRVNVELVEGDNYITFVAENLGSIKPNTASFEVQTTENMFKLTMNGNLSQSDAILIEKL